MSTLHIVNQIQKGDVTMINIIIKAFMLYGALSATLFGIGVYLLLGGLIGVLALFTGVTAMGCIVAEVVRC